MTEIIPAIINFSSNNPIIFAILFLFLFAIFLSTILAIVSGIGEFLNNITDKLIIKNIYKCIDKHGWPPQLDSKENIFNYHKNLHPNYSNFNTNTECICDGKSLCTGENKNDTIS